MNTNKSVMGVLPLYPSGTNSTIFTECCNVAICDDQENCPVCKNPVVGFDAKTRGQRNKIRWHRATRHWPRDKSGRYVG